jgi:hypothetical protein
MRSKAALEEQCVGGIGESKVAKSRVLGIMSKYNTLNSTWSYGVLRNGMLVFSSPCANLRYSP